MREGENPMVEKVSGYRVLSDEELQLVNHLKELGPVIEPLLRRIEAVIKQGPADVDGGDRMRSLALGKTNLQQSFMWLIRAVAAPKGLV